MFTICAQMGIKKLKKLEIKKICWCVFRIQDKDMIKCIRNIIFSLVSLLFFRSLFQLLNLWFFLISSFLMPIWAHIVNNKSYANENFQTLVDFLLRHFTPFLWEQCSMHCDTDPRGFFCWITFVVYGIAYIIFAWLF